MKHQVFRKMVERAKAGEKQAMEQLLFLCKPLIDHYSYVKGRPDEDCRQEVILWLIRTVRHLPF